MSKRSYGDSTFGANQQVTYPGNDGTTWLLTGQAGTTGETKTHSTTLKEFGFGRAVLVKKLIYTVTTVHEGTGNNLGLQLNLATTSVGELSLTTETAGEVATSSDINSTVTAGEYIQVVIKSTTTASDGSTAIGFLGIVYEEQFTTAS